jgi:hypothetical protein
MQRRHILRVLTAFAFGTFIIAPMAARSDEPSSSSTMGRMNHWAADQEALLDAKITGFKAGLKLTPDQEILLRGRRSMATAYGHGLLTKREPVFGAWTQVKVALP